MSNELNKDQPYQFMVGMIPGRNREKRKPLGCVVIMADSVDLAWGLFRRQEGYKWDIVELQPTSPAGKFLKRLGHADRNREGEAHDRKYERQLRATNRRRAIARQNKVR